jgi:diadenosine tetraphosphate (Ap4A) HIT family hydrolase
MFFILLFIFSNCHAHPSDMYSQNDIFPKDYWKHWIVSISPRQHKLASFVISAKREIEHIYELDLEEIAEFVRIVKDMEETLCEIPVFAPDRFNYLQLGNKQNHFHYHVIPRYASPRNFHQIEWIDDNYGHAPFFTNYKHPQYVLDAIRLEIQKHKNIFHP